MSGANSRDRGRARWIIVSLICALAGGLGLATHRLMPRATVCKITVSDLYAITHAIDNFAVDHQGRYPFDLDELLRDQAYLKLAEAPCDPWARPYGYELKPGGRGFRVWTLGADGEIGGQGDDEDLSMEK